MIFTVQSRNDSKVILRVFFPVQTFNIQQPKVNKTPAGLIYYGPPVTRVSDPGPAEPGGLGGL